MSEGFVGVVCGGGCRGEEAQLLGGVSEKADPAAALEAVFAGLGVVAGGMEPTLKDAVLQ